MASSSTSKQPLMAATSFSGGSTSDRRVKPRTSANKIVTGRRSPSTAPRSLVACISRAARSCRGGVTKRETLVKQGLVPKNVIPQHVIPQDMIREDLVPEHVIPQDMIREDLVPEHVIPDDLVPEHMVSDDLVPEHMVSDDLVPEHVIAVDAATDLVCKLRQHRAHQAIRRRQVWPANMRGAIRHGPHYVEQASALRRRTHIGDRSSTMRE